MDKELLLYHYFSNQLSTEERTVFDELLKSDQEFREQYHFEKNLKEVIRDKESIDLKEKLKVFESELAKQDIPARAKSRFKDYQKWAVAASIILLVGLGYLGYQDLASTSYHQLYEKNFQDYPNTAHAITRGEGGAESIEIQAFVAYETDNTAKAISLFTELRKTKDTEVVNFYLAQSYLKSGEMEKAIGSLDRVIEFNGEFLPQALWYKSLAHIKLEEKTQALKSLGDLVGDGRYKKTEAERIINELR